MKKYSSFTNSIRKLKVYLFTLAMFLCCLFTSSCNDDMAPEHYYTFTGEMVSDYLKNNPDFSMFCQIVERAKTMDLLASRGEYTVFPPTNEAIKKYLADNNYNSIEDIPVERCDSMVFCHIIPFMYTTFDFSDNNTYLNMLELPLNIIASDSLDENSERISFINTNSAIINKLKNDSVENGVIHPIDAVIVPNTSMGSSLLEDNKSEFTIFFEALKQTGLLGKMESYIDLEYEEVRDNFPETRVLDSGSAGNVYTAKRPDRRLDGFTVFIVPDKVLEEQYKINTSSLTEGVKALYDIAYETYMPVAEQMGITQDDINQYWNMNPESLKNPKNPLYMFMAYHMLDRFFAGESLFINCWSINTAKANPTEWINTMLPHTTLKIEKVYKSIDPLVEYTGEFYLNHSSRTEFLPRVRGAHITTPSNNIALNCAYYYIDRFIAYNQEMQGTVMNTRMRIDFLTIFPEFTNNNIRLNGQPWKGYGTWDNDTEYRYGTNYYIPGGYLKNVSLNDNGIFFVMRPHNTFWNMGGDEVNLLGTSYDFKFKLPSVPSGNYEIRLGFTGKFPNRGIAQIYFDDIPQGLPIDMRLGADDPSIGGKFWVAMTDEELLENNQIMKNNGCYRGPASLYAYHGGKGEQNTVPIYKPNECTDFNTPPDIYRRILCKVQLSGTKDHYLRIRSVYTTGSSSAFMMDYLELVPYSVCGVGGMGEDVN